MPAFIDVTCPKCRKRFGWCGEMINRPPCPKCGHQIDKAALEETDRQLQEAEDAILAEMAKCKADKLQKLKDHYETPHQSSSTDGLPG